MQFNFRSFTFLPTYLRFGGKESLVGDSGGKDEKDLKSEKQVWKLILFGSYVIWFRDKF